MSRILRCDGCGIEIVGRRDYSFYSDGVRLSIQKGHKQTLLDACNTDCAKKAFARAVEIVGEP